MPEISGNKDNFPLNLGIYYYYKYNLIDMILLNLYFHVLLP